MSTPLTKPTASKPAQGVPFYTPAQEPPAGTATALDPQDPHKIPTLFQPLTIRSVTLANRFVVSPMCQYSADDGHLTDWHLVHLGTLSARGAALTIVEATAVLPNGRISPEDSGLWKDSQIAPLRRITDFIHSQGHKAGIQLSHAGRKASTLAPWHGQRGKPHVAGEDVGGWPDNVWGPSAIPFSHTYPQVKEMTVEQIRETVEAFGAAAKRAVEAGFDVIEIHGAHGYLQTAFMSPLSNQRTDEYGGSFENRIRFLIEVIKAVRAAIPDTMPLFVRISATEWMEWSGKETWDLPQSIQLAHVLPDLGVDLLDVSSGGNAVDQKIQIHPYYQVNLAGEIRASLKKAGKDKMLIGAVGMITDAEMARDIVQNTCSYVVGEDPEMGDCKHSLGTSAEVHEDNAKADVVIIARQFLREPEFVLRAARHLGVQVKWPNQYMRGEWPDSQRI
ncbi:FMN-linked oxidoreductase [Cryphonectria parasitica EP155]|uniref:FMN-linked oxidoreductase n=1 Tax=Cryphonectria parasitica (strain ATCC 38755 / EP155) TaxID=660469 RepID=A0A9P5CSU0_CRYP1|nr:FMN-linked oxidoreductase [Cryphonectria parasitica EP155]KAF3768977.1 FMN-linked oxidoreductase [Cryphonectria parasitica EP155]